MVKSTPSKASCLAMAWSLARAHTLVEGGPTLGSSGPHCCEGLECQTGSLGVEGHYHWRGRAWRNMADFPEDEG